MLLVDELDRNLLTTLFVTNNIRYLNFSRTEGGMPARRNPFHAPAVVSRRGGPIKEPLSREAIVTVALDLLRRDDSPGLSLRNVAAALETGPASLYAYVEDVHELQALVLDRALEDVDTTSLGGGPWRARLIALLKSYGEVLSRTPKLAGVAASTIGAGPNVLRILETMLGLLAEGNVERARAAWAVDLLTLYITAIAFEQAQRRSQNNPLGPVTKVIGMVSPESFPHVFAARHDLLAGGSRVTWALEVLLNGLLATPLPPRTSSDGDGAYHPSSAKPER